MALPTTQQHTRSLNETSELITRNETGGELLKKARRLLYLSHFFAQFSEAAWQFALILFLAAFTNYQSLFLISTYGVTSGLSIFLLGAKAGRFVDGSNRLFAATFFIWTENLSVVTATILCYLLLHHLDTAIAEQTFSTVTPWSVFLLVGIHFWGSVASILDAGFLVAIERDWVVIMSQEVGPKGSPQTQKWLSETNVMMKQIDLSCRIVAPALAGLVLGAFDDSSSQQQTGGSDLASAALVVGAVNIAALMVEYSCTYRIYHLIPKLAERTHRAAVPESEFTNKNCRRIGLPSALIIYMKQDVAWAGLGLSLLYLNALTFGGLMTGYLAWRGMRLETVGIWRGISAAVGLCGTFVFHFSVNRTTLINTGMWSILYQFCCISVSFSSLFVKDYLTSTSLLIGGVCCSRIGLWVFDISVTQLMQQYIPAGIRGQVGGTQQSLNAFFQLLSFALALLFPNPKEFHIYVSAGYCAAGIAVVFFAGGIYARQGALLMADECT
ncbi:solute carrier family 40 (iron-regulated transporter), member 1 [Fistulifera solaris]|uniref:Solute carrier family 40 member n=1 Tax=Fistulifera solaris TaxID=1519565 RepID=A0A1Z5KKX2_FISSO|nr:solute carrier family 40 (iron-regulated transporter), member 1 [Fistulifera solaris]|eukprot:GAX26929.1 solute carrier family 40 (iron-regulated transporter), member 1 [Fistulifera solaris]